MARRNQDRDQRMFKDAAASESDLDRGSPERLGGSLSTSPKRDIITLLPPASETRPEADRPAEGQPRGDISWMPVTRSGAWN